MSTREPGQELLDRLLPAAEGKGPLLQRDYWGVIDSCRTSPAGLIDILRIKFCELAPPQLARFRRVNMAEEPLEVGDELEVSIRGAGTFGVRVVHLDRQSFTVATLRGHPEAGRITFGAYRNERGDVIFHIRSRARSSSATRYLGFLVAGEPMQTSTWGELINRVAASVGEGVIGFIQAETSIVDDDEGDRKLTGPTFRATGD
jgi:hypothetical protein